VLAVAFWLLVAMLAIMTVRRSSEPRWVSLISAGTGMMLLAVSGLYCFKARFDDPLREAPPRVECRVWAPCQFGTLKSNTPEFRFFQHTAPARKGCLHRTRAGGCSSARFCHPCPQLERPGSKTMRRAIAALRLSMISVRWLSYPFSTSSTSSALPTGHSPSPRAPTLVQFAVAAMAAKPHPQQLEGMCLHRAQYLLCFPRVHCSTLNSTAT